MDRRSVSTVTRGIGVPFPAGAASRPVLEPTQAPIQGVKRSGREGDHSPPPSAEVKNAWSHAAAPPYVFIIVWCLINLKDNCTTRTPQKREPTEYRCGDDANSQVQEL
jgi:hypothetical protein